jgi:hypothetical protein
MSENILETKQNSQITGNKSLSPTREEISVLSTPKNRFSFDASHESRRLEALLDIFASGISARSGFIWRLTI